MINLCFAADGEFVCDEKWPFVPRIGEHVVLTKPSGCWRVTHVTWEREKGEIVAPVLMQKLTGDMRRM